MLVPDSGEGEIVGCRARQQSDQLYGSVHFSHRQGLHTYIHILQSIMHIHTFIYLLFNQKSNACMHTNMLGLVCRFLSAPAGQEIAQRAVGQLRRGETRCRPGKHSYIHTYRQTAMHTHINILYTLLRIFPYIHTYIHTWFRTLNPVASDLCVLKQYIHTYIHTYISTTDEASLRKSVHEQLGGHAERLFGYERHLGWLWYIHRRLGCRICVYMNVCMYVFI